MNRRFITAGTVAVIAAGLLSGIIFWPHAQAQEAIKDAVTAAPRNDSAPRLPISTITVRTTEAANAIRLTGQELQWDGPSLKFTNNEKATALVTKQYRKGWELMAGHGTSTSSR